MTSAAGRGQFLLVAGEAGIGKTRFLDAIDQKARERGFVGAWGLVAPQDSDVPAAVDPRPRADHAPRAALRRPRTRAPRAARCDRRGRARPPPPARHGRRRPDPGRGHAIRRCSGFDDLQWADDLSLELIGELARRSRDRQLLLCGGYRTDEAPPGTSLRDWRSRLLTQRIAEEVRLAPLDQGRHGARDHADPGHRPAGAARGGRRGLRAHRRHPAPHRGAARRARAPRRCANGLAIREATVPDTIEDAVLARLSHRSPEAQAVARAGAIIGRCFVPEVLAGDHGRRPRSDRGAAPGADRQLRPRSARHRGACSTSATSSCATRSIGASRSPIAGGSTPVPASSARTSRASPRSIRRCTSSAPACAAGVRDGAGRRPRRGPPVRPSRGLRALPPRRRQPAGRPRASRARRDPPGVRRRGRGDRGERDRRAGRDRCGGRVPRGGRAGPGDRGDRPAIFIAMAPQRAPDLGAPGLRRRPARASSTRFRSDARDRSSSRRARHLRRRSPTPTPAPSRRRARSFAPHARAWGSSLDDQDLRAGRRLEVRRGRLRRRSTCEAGLAAGGRGRPAARSGPARRAPASQRSATRRRWRCSPWTTREATRWIHEPDFATPTRSSSRIART